MSEENADTPEVSTNLTDPSPAAPAAPVPAPASDPVARSESPDPPPNRGPSQDTADPPVEPGAVTAEASADVSPSAEAEADAAVSAAEEAAGDQKEPEPAAAAPSSSTAADDPAPSDDNVPPAAAAAVEEAEATNNAEDSKKQEREDDIPFVSDAAPPAPAPAPATVEGENQVVVDQISDDEDEEEDALVLAPSRPARTSSVIIKEDSNNAEEKVAGEEKDNNSGFLPPIKGASPPSGHRNSTTNSSSNHLLASSGSAHYAQPTQSSSFRNTPKRSTTPHSDNDGSSNTGGESGGKRAWKPSSRVPDLVASARDLLEEMKAPKKKFGPAGPVRRLQPNLFHQLHLAIYQRPPIRMNSKIKAPPPGSPVVRSPLASSGGGPGFAGAAAAATTGGGGGGGVQLPYSLIPPAARNAANSLAPAPPIENVSALNTGITSSVYASRKPPSSVLSILCVTGDAETDAVPSTSCLRVLPAEDHRSVAIERIVPVPPREGVRLQGQGFLGEDSTFLSRSFATFDGVAAERGDWETMADLIGGNFLAGAVAGGVCRSGVVLLNACPESEKVTAALADGAHPFVNKVAEVLLSVCTEQELRQLQAAERKREEEEAAAKAQKVADVDVSDVDSVLDFVPHAPRSARKAAGGHLSPRKAVQASSPNKGGPRKTASASAAAAAAAKVPAALGRAKSITDVPVGSDGLPLRAVPGAPRVANLQPDATVPSRSLVTFDPNDPLADFFSFDHVAVSAVDIAPGGGGETPTDTRRGSMYEPSAILPTVPSPQSVSDTVFDTLTGNKVELANRKRHVPRRLHPVPVKVVPGDKTEAIACKTVQEVGDACSRIVATKPVVSGAHRILYLKLQKSGANRETIDPTLQLGYEPTIMFVFLSPHMRKMPELHPAKGADPKFNGGLTHSTSRAILRDHRELASLVEHFSKFDGVGKDSLLTQATEFQGALASLLSSGALLRADVAHMCCLSAVRAFSVYQKEALQAVSDLDAVKRLPVHPRAVSTFVHQGLPPIELPPLVEKAAEHVAKSLPSPPRPVVVGKKKVASPSRSGAHAHAKR